VCERETDGGAALEALLRDKRAKAPLIPELDRNDLIAMAVWYIWWERRQATHGERVQSPVRSAHAISVLALNYSRARGSGKSMMRHGWSKPREDFVKLNVDAGFDIDTGKGTTGSVLRDDRGQFLAASCRELPFISDDTTAEATALRDGLLLAGQIGCNRIEVNSDCLEVMEIMMDGGDSMGAAAAIYEECTFLCHNFTEVVFFPLP
jgi:hypothetical protein